MSTDTRFDKQASEILQRYQGRAQVDAARAWCDQNAEQLPQMAIDWLPMKRAPDVVEVIRIATLEDPFLGKMVTDLSTILPASGLPSVDALFPVMVLWPIRETPAQYAHALATWARERAKVERSCAGRAYLAARSLRAWPELAYAILDGLEEGSQCSNCHVDARVSVHRCRTIIALTRRAERLDQHPLDEAAFLSISVEDVLEDESVRSIASSAVATGTLPPALLVAIREAVMSENPLQRIRAVRLLLASRPDQEDAVRRLASWFSDRDVAAALVLNGGELNAACTGAGWGRDHHNLARKLLPFTSSLWFRDSSIQGSPMYPLRCLFSHTDDAGAWDRVRECVAEHLLEIAVSPASPSSDRMAALDAFEALEPGGDGSTIRALARVKDNEAIAARAKAVQRALAEKLKKRARLTDSELAVDDAWKKYWSSLDQRAEPCAT